ncbi:MAG: DUF6188 family protein [Alphaproteobacteria bacterium]
MYGLPKDFDEGFLINRTLELICFSMNQIFFHFDSHVSISVENSFSYQKGPTDVEAKTKVPVVNSNLMELLQRTVVEARGDAEGTLTLVFDDKRVLKFFDQPGYEAYSIEGAGKLIIV